VREGCAHPLSFLGYFFSTFAPPEKSGDIVKTYTCQSHSGVFPCIVPENAWNLPPNWGMVAALKSR
jgi:hypothetical protein